MLLSLRLGLLAMAMTLVSLIGTLNSIKSSLSLVTVRSANAISVWFSYICETEKLLFMDILFLLYT